MVVMQHKGSKRLMAGHSWQTASSMPAIGKWHLMSYLKMFGKW